MDPTMTEWPSDKAVTEYTFILKDFTQRTILAIVTAFVFFVGIPGNTLVILAVTLSRRLRSPTYWLVVNLAVTDFITCVFIPFHIVALLSRQGWPLSEWICAVSAAISFICVTSSTTNLALIAFNRWYLLTQPLGSFQKMFRRKNICLMVAFAWIYSVLLIVVPPLQGVGGLGYSYKFKTCSVVNSSPAVNFYSGILGVGMFLLPTIPIVTFYIFIYRFVRRHTLKMTSGLSNTTTSTDGTSHGVSSTSQVSLEICSMEQVSASSNQNIPTTMSTKDHQSTGSSREQINITKKLALIVCIFFACFLPIMVCSIVPSEATNPAVAWAELLVVTNSCINPIIYARTIPAFREIMGCILRCRFDTIPAPIGFIRRFRLK